MLHQGIVAAFFWEWLEIINSINTSYSIILQYFTSFIAFY